jgi:hypothetical protein
MSMVDDNLSFGNSGKYYASAFAGDQRLLGDDRSRESGFLQDLLKTHNPELRQRVERAFRQWNGIIRDYLRSEMGLRLTVGDDAQAVPVKIVAGLPEALADVYSRFPREIWEILLRLPLLESTNWGLGFLVDYHWALENRRLFHQPLDPPSHAEFCRVRDAVERILSSVKALKIDELLRTIPHDVLGAYFFRLPVIKLYWMAIGLISGMLGVEVEALTLVVASHELAHAYSHLGRDIDGERWDTESFAKADLCIAEGLAQFYTYAVCKKLEPRFPAAQKAYESLLQIQSGPYRVQESWLNDGKDKSAESQRVGEVIRASMIECRAQRVTIYAKFASCIAHNRGVFSHKKAPSTSSA